jgi:hypothetical protein
MLKMLAEIITEVAISLFSNESIDLEETATYRYWENLNYEDQYYYFTNNEYLKDYMKNDYYASDRYMTAKHVARIADKLNREFTNKYDRY